MCIPFIHKILKIQHRIDIERFNLELVFLFFRKGCYELKQYSKSILYKNDNCGKNYVINTIVFSPKHKRTSIPSDTIPMMQFL